MRDWSTAHSQQRHATLMFSDFSKCLQNTEVLVILHRNTTSCDVFSE